MYLTDFGLLRVMSSTRAMGTRTLQAGTPDFQAPEQFKAVDIKLTREQTSMLSA